MIPLRLPAVAEAPQPFVTRLRARRDGESDPADSFLVGEDADGASFAGRNGLIALDGVPAGELDGDVVLIVPERDGAARAERIVRAGSPHNTLLVTECCDQLCVMCSQPPKKTHVDRFGWLEEASLLARPDMLIGVSGGEPTLYKEELLGMIERVLMARPDLEFHVLSNAQHFGAGDVERLRDPLYRRVSWGIPLYAADPGLHDRIVGKPGAFERLEQSLAHLLMAGARVELRTVLLADNLGALPELARLVTARLRFIEIWSIMQLERTGFARNRWARLRVDHARCFDRVAEALDCAELHGVRAQLFNFPRCTVPAHYRDRAPASISDWKRKYMPACAGCGEREACCGYFEWHPDEEAMAEVSPL